MVKLYSTDIDTVFGTKSIEVYNGDVLYFNEHIDILTTSAYYRSYHATQFSMFASLEEEGISVELLARSPYMDLRDACNVWLSRQIRNTGLSVDRIGCIETERKADGAINQEKMMLAFKSYFSMLNMACNTGVSMRTVVVPLVGTGDQNIDVSLMLMPIISECLFFLKTNRSVKRLVFIERNRNKAEFIVGALRNSYAKLHEDIEKAYKQSVKKEKRLKKAFISYSTKDTAIADTLYEKLVEKGIQTWYAPKNCVGRFPEEIVNGIDDAEYFILVLSGDSQKSKDVTNEIVNAIAREKKIRLLRIDAVDIKSNGSTSYYLSQYSWKDAIWPPIEKKIEEFVDSIYDEE